jgi:hypothetical protein
MRELGACNTKQNTNCCLYDSCSLQVEMGDTVYIYSIIVGAATAMFSLFASTVINCLGKKKIIGMLIYSRNECIKLVEIFLRSYIFYFLFKVSTLICQVQLF